MNNMMPDVLYLALIREYKKQYWREKGESVIVTAVEACNPSAVAVVAQTRDSQERIIEQVSPEEVKKIKGHRFALILPVEVGADQCETEGIHPKVLAFLEAQAREAVGS